MVIGGALSTCHQRGGRGAGVIQNRKPGDLGVTLDRLIGGSVGTGGSGIANQAGLHPMEKKLIGTGKKCKPLKNTRKFSQTLYNISIKNYTCFHGGMRADLVFCRGKFQPCLVGAEGK